MELVVSCIDCTLLLHTSIRTSVRQSTNPPEQVSERSAESYIRTATRSHRKNNNASIATRRVTSSRCQAIVFRSYTLHTSLRASTATKEPVQYHADWIATRIKGERVAIEDTEGLGPEEAS